MKTIWKSVGMSAALGLLATPCLAADLQTEILIPAKRGVVTFGLPYHSLAPRATVSRSVLRGVTSNVAPPMPNENLPVSAPAGGLPPVTTPALPNPSVNVPPIEPTAPTPAVPSLPNALPSLPGSPAPAH